MNEFGHIYRWRGFGFFDFKPSRLIYARYAENFGWPVNASCWNYKGLFLQISWIQRTVLCSLWRYSYRTLWYCRLSAPWNIGLQPEERAEEAILAVCKRIPDTDAMTFIENDVSSILQRLPDNINSEHYHDDETHISALLEANVLSPKVVQSWRPQRCVDWF